MRVFNTILEKLRRLSVATCLGRCRLIPSWTQGIRFVP